LSNQLLNLRPSRPVRLLVGDIGATHSRLAIYRHRPGHVERLRQQTYASADYGCLMEVLASFLDVEQKDVAAACLGLPAPIHAGVAFPLTNLPWEVDRDEVVRAIGTDRVALINDVEASAAGIPGLSPEELVCLQTGQADPSGNRVVLSVGTGLGVSVLTATGSTFATEAGHATFSPRRDPDFDLQATLQREYGHVSWERVASGSGLPRIHALLAGDPSPRLDGPEIARRADTDPTCKQAVDTLRRYIGDVAGNIALTLMASGGLYISGGVATRVLENESAAPFLLGFWGKGRMRRLLERVPIFVVHEDGLALRGAAQTAVALFESNWT
jgi:glucokinase